MLKCSRNICRNCVIISTRSSEESLSSSPGTQATAFSLLEEDEFQSEERSSSPSRRVQWRFFITKIIITKNERVTWNGEDEVKQQQWHRNEASDGLGREKEGVWSSCNYVLFGPIFGSQRENTERTWPQRETMTSDHTSLCISSVSHQQLDLIRAQPATSPHAQLSHLFLPHHSITYSTPPDQTSSLLPELFQHLIGNIEVFPFHLQQQPTA